MHEDMPNKEKDKSDFFRIYANLPIDVRKEIILIVENRPITWNVAYDEISNSTVIGKKILDKIIAWGFI